MSRSHCDSKIVALPDCVESELGAGTSRAETQRRGENNLAHNDRLIRCPSLRLRASARVSKELRFATVHPEVGGGDAFGAPRCTRP